MLQAAGAPRWLFTPVSRGQMRGVLLFLWQHQQPAEQNRLLVVVAAAAVLCVVAPVGCVQQYCRVSESARLCVCSVPCEEL